MIDRLYLQLTRFKDGCIAGRYQLVMHFRELQKANQPNLNAIALDRNAIQALDDLIKILNLLCQVLDAIGHMGTILFANQPKESDENNNNQGA